MVETYEIVRFYKLDIEKLPDVALKLNLRAMRTYVLFKDEGGDYVVDQVNGTNVMAVERAIVKQIELLRGSPRRPWALSQICKGSSEILS